MPITAPVYFADLNGNGRADLLYFNNRGELLAAANLDGVNYRWGTPQVVDKSRDRFNVHFADLNGDGKAEMVYIDAAQNLIAAATSTASPAIGGRKRKWATAGKNPMCSSPTSTATAKPKRQ